MTIPAPALPALAAISLPGAEGPSRPPPGAAAACRRRQDCQGAAARRVAATAMERLRSGCKPVRKARPREPGEAWVLGPGRRPPARAAGAWPVISSGKAPGRGSTGLGGASPGVVRSSAGAPGSGPGSAPARPSSDCACSGEGPAAGSRSTGRARGKRTNRAAISRSSSHTWLRPARAAWARAASRANRSVRCPSSPSCAAAAIRRRSSASGKRTRPRRPRACRIDPAAARDGPAPAGKESRPALSKAGSCSSTRRRSSRSGVAEPSTSSPTRA